MRFSLKKAERLSCCCLTETCIMLVKIIDRISNCRAQDLSSPFSKVTKKLKITKLKITKLKITKLKIIKLKIIGWVTILKYIKVSILKCIKVY